MALTHSLGETKNALPPRRQDLAASHHQPYWRCWSRLRIVCAALERWGSTRFTTSSLRGIEKGDEEANSLLSTFLGLKLLALLIS